MQAASQKQDATICSREIVAGVVPCGIVYFVVECVQFWRVVSLIGLAE